MNAFQERPTRAHHDLLVKSFAQSRIVAANIRADILPVLQPMARTGAERLLRAIAARRIFDGETLVEIEVLIEKIAPLINAGIERVECWENDPHNVSGTASWTELRSSKQAERLRQAERALRDLGEIISAVIDHQYAEATSA